MKRYLLASVALSTALGGPAFAQAPGTSWEGFYVGGVVGGGISSDSTNRTINLNPPGGAAGVTNPVASTWLTTSSTGPLGGVQLGWNHQLGAGPFGNLVGGIEGDWVGTGQSQSTRNTQWLASTVFVAPSILNDVNRHHIEWLSTVRARLGVSNGPVFWYATGGLALGEVTTRSSLQANTLAGTLLFGPSFGSKSTDSTQTGWTLGGGVETSLGWLGMPNQWSAKVEYLYVDLGSVTNSFNTAAGPGLPGAAYSDRVKTRITDNIVKFGLNYHFNCDCNAQPQPSGSTLAQASGTSWEGFYVGGVVGGAIGSGSTSRTINLNPPGVIGPGGVAPGVLNPIASTKQTTSSTGPLGGVQLGWNHQLGAVPFGNLVGGIEGDWAGTDQSQSTRNTQFLASSTTVAPTVLNDTNRQNIEWVSTVRARLGVSNGPVFWYATGGLALGEVTTRSTLAVNGVTFPTIFGTAAGSRRTDSTQTGWTLGGGVETSLAWLGMPNQWSGKIEYLYVDLGTVTNSFNVLGVASAPATTYTDRVKTRISDNIVKFGLNYHF